MSLTRNAADAEDLVQDTLVRAFRAIDGFDGRHPRAWLLTILRNTNINNHRKRRPELMKEPDGREERPDARGPDTSSEAAYASRRVAHHLEDCLRCGMEVVTYRRIKETLGRGAREIDPGTIERLRAFGEQLAAGQVDGGGEPVR